MIIYYFEAVTEKKTEHWLKTGISLKRIQSICYIRSKSETPKFGKRRNKIVGNDEEMFPCHKSICRELR